MKRAVLVTLSFACLVPSLALAGPAGRVPTRSRVSSTARADEPLHFRVARAVFPREHWKRLMTEASAELAQEIAEKGKGQIELAPEFADRLREQYEHMAPYEDMLQYQARILGSQYSRAELRRLLSFYGTPLGKKSVPFMRDMMASSMQRVQFQVQGGLAEALSQLRPLVRRAPPAKDRIEVQPNQDEQADGAQPTDANGDRSASAPSDDKAL